MGTRISGILSKYSKDYFLHSSLLFIYLSFTVILLQSSDLRHHILHSATTSEDVFSTVAIPFLHYCTYNHTVTVTEQGVQCFLSLNMYLHKIFIFLFQTLFDNFTNMTIQAIYI